MPVSGRRGKVSGVLPDPGGVPKLHVPASHSEDLRVWGSGELHSLAALFRRLLGSIGFVEPEPYPTGPSFLNKENPNVVVGDLKCKLYNGSFGLDGGSIL